MEPLFCFSLFQVWYLSLTGGAQKPSEGPQGPQSWWPPACLTQQLGVKAKLWDMDVWNPVVETQASRVKVILWSKETVRFFSGSANMTSPQLSWL